MAFYPPILGDGLIRYSFGTLEILARKITINGQDIISILPSLNFSVGNVIPYSTLTINPKALTIDSDGTFHLYEASTDSSNLPSSRQNGIITGNTQRFSGLKLFMSGAAVASLFLTDGISQFGDPAALISTDTQQEISFTFKNTFISMIGYHTVHLNYFRELSGTMTFQNRIGIGGSGPTGGALTAPLVMSFYWVRFGKSCTLTIQDNQYNTVTPRGELNQGALPMQDSLTCRITDISTYPNYPSLPYQLTGASGSNTIMAYPYPIQVLNISHTPPSNSIQNNGFTGVYETTAYLCGSNGFPTSPYTDANAFIFIQIMNSTALNNTFNDQGFYGFPALTMNYYADSIGI